MKRFGATKDAWIFRTAKPERDDIKRQGQWEMKHFFHSGRELVLSQYEIATDFQTLPPDDAPICFERAVIGLGSQCSQVYCENNIPVEIYQGFRDEIADYYWQTPQVWQKHLSDSRESIRGKEKENNNPNLQEKPNSPLKCLDGARYYNFEGTGSGNPAEDGEKMTRIGQRFPEALDMNYTFKTDLSENGPGTNRTGKSRKLVVGIVQREESRRLLNDQDLVKELVEAGFRVKWMSFDHGCGLAETAYLLRDVNVLVSPHGNAIGTSIFMPTNNPVPTLISIDNSQYQESWFKFTSTALGQRFISSTCGPTSYVDKATEERCPYYRDYSGGQRLLRQLPIILGLPESMVKTDAEKNAMTEWKRDRRDDYLRTYVRWSRDAQELAAKEFEMLIGREVPRSLIQKYGEDAWTFLNYFWKDIPRYVDVPRLTKFIGSLQEDSEREESVDLRNGSSPYRQFIEYVRNGEACGENDCQDKLQRNVAGAESAFGQHSINNVELWGLPTTESKALRPELVEVRHWKIDV
ncbi:hypothetical protein BGW38_002419 [Lunasporangiospora selenospora]|uniref:Glycosyltransferase 61 catalytic domain-containing protein n=1 Tax=Lunasporangiospora selenospora TaxID=979761 RepID=A0A9P6G1B9_9FUNG|nr:hypothetical protein BGW38_002419 [Lunasporangiospora selenospora]